VDTGQQQHRDKDECGRLCVPNHVALCVPKIRFCNIGDEVEPSFCFSKETIRPANPATLKDSQHATVLQLQAEVLRRSLARLSPEHGEVIDLVYYHGKSVKEVAEIIGIAEATVKTRMFYAQKKPAALVATA
jgi:RNA polymerase sigma factor (sigma-70 family)